MKRKDQADSAAVIPNQTQLRQLNQTGNSLKSQLHNNNYVWRGGGAKENNTNTFQKTHPTYTSDCTSDAPTIGKTAYLPNTITTQTHCLKIWKEVTPTADSGLIPRAAYFLVYHIV